MNNYLYFLGHQPHLSLAELESVYGPDYIKAITSQYALLELDNRPDIDTLGGTTKISEVLKSEVLAQNYQEQIQDLVLAYLAEQKNSKIKLGISIYSGTKSIKATKSFVQKLLEGIREQAKKELNELNLHTVAAKSSTLNTAQIVHPGLLKTNGLSLDIIITPSRHPGEGRDPVDITDDRQSIILARTIQVPNLKKYTLRDYGKPKPSGSNGMLPPKLAQIMLNLSQIKPGQTALDPFCGSGTVLQEALLQGINAVGTDLNPTIIEDARANLAWLMSHPSLGRARFALASQGGVNPLLASPKGGSKFKIEVADATTNQWSEQFDTVVCEGYLGKALSKEPSPDKLLEIISECNEIAEKFLKNIYTQISANQTLVIALPCWFTQNQITRLPVVEKLTALGYNQKKYVKVKEDLVYHRSGNEKSQQRNQLVGRDIYILTKKAK